MNIRAIGLEEVKAINRILQANRIDAWATLENALAVRSSFIAYPLRLRVGERQTKVASLLREMSNAIFDVRRSLMPNYQEPTPVRLREYPYALEVPYPYAKPLPSSEARIRSPRFHALIGRWYEFGQPPQEQYIDLERDYHVLIAAMSGGGKSTLMRMMLLTLLANTSPEHLQVVIIDLKNDDFPVFRQMPHVVQFAGETTSAAIAVAALESEMRRRVECGERKPKLLLVIDELAQLRSDRVTMSRISDLLGMGRALGIHVWAATQYPNRETITTEINVNFTTRLVGRVDGPNAASVATKRAASGAHLLGTPGDFLKVDTEMRRFKAYWLSQSETASLIATWRLRWRHVCKTQNLELPKDGGGGDMRVLEIAEKIAPLVAAGASQNEMIRSVFGPGANTGGSNLAWIKRARAYLEEKERGNERGI